MHHTDSSVNFTASKVEPGEKSVTLKPKHSRSLSPQVLLCFAILVSFFEAPGFKVEAGKEMLLSTTAVSAGLC